MKITTRQMVLIPLFTALTIIGSFFRMEIPGYPAPFTLQIFFVVLSGLLLGKKGGLFSQILYVVIGLLGVPVFSRGAGIGYVFNPSFGFIIGFVLASPAIAVLYHRLRKFTKEISALFLSSLVGIFIIYGIGVSYMYIILNKVLQNNITFIQALWSGCLIFLPFDLLKITAASIVSQRILQRTSKV
ncbi:MAG: biotin transporter BioY [Clostridia bacterium]